MLRVASLISPDEEPEPARLRTSDPRSGRQKTPGARPSSEDMKAWRGQIPHLREEGGRNPGHRGHFKGGRLGSTIVRAAGKGLACTKCGGEAAVARPPIMALDRRTCEDCVWAGILRSTASHRALLAYRQHR